MNKDIALLNRLIIVLDDSRDFYISASRRISSSYLTFLVHRFIQTHAMIADELAEQLRADGVRPARMGSKLGRLRARYAKWLAASNPDIDVGYLTEISRCETRVVQRFGAAADKSGALRQRLQNYRHELERVQSLADHHMQEMNSRSVAGIKTRLTSSASLDRHPLIHQPALPELASPLRSRSPTPPAAQA